MAAPTEAQCIKKTLANGEPSTHGAKRSPAPMSAPDPKRNFAASWGKSVMSLLGDEAVDLGTLQRPISCRVPEGARPFRPKSVLGFPGREDE